MSKPYNGHPSWNAWNVSLWIGNDEGLYRSALDCIRQTRTRDEAAELFLSMLIENGTEKTPDGARFTKSTIKHAMRGME